MQTDLCRKKIHGIMGYNHIMRYFIYQITNLKNNRFYIGQHRHDGEFLDSNYYGSGTAIVRAIKKHGIQNFKREVLVECTSEAALNFMESVYVGPELINDKKCYNLKTGGMGGNHSEETKAKIRATLKGRIRPEETKAKMSASLRGKKAWNKGKTNSDETKAKISATLKGKSQPQVQCPSCQKIGGRPIMHRYHFDNCKECV
jgi:group I intron endonuclease